MFDNLQKTFGFIPNGTSLNNHSPSIPEEVEEHFRNNRPELKVNSLPEVLPMTLEMIPIPLREWVSDEAKRMEVPLDFIAVPAIVAIGSLIGTRCEIRPKQRDNFSIIPNLYGGIVAAPSRLKSPAMKVALNPLVRLETIERESYKKKQQDYSIEKTIYEDSCKKVDTELKKGKINKIAYRCKLEQLHEEEPEEPTEKRFIIMDSTMEKIIMIAKENPQGFIVIRDELDGLLRSFDKSGREEDRAAYLTGWNGNSDYRRDRVSGGSLFVKSFCLSLFGTIQPDKLAKLFFSAIKGNNDGLIQRLQLLIYPDYFRRTGRMDKEVNKQAKEDAFKLYQKIAEADYGRLGAVTDQYESTPYFRFDKNIQSSYLDWAEALEIKLESPDLSPIQQEHFGKYRSLLPSLALIFHIIDIAESEASGPVSPSAFYMAKEWCEYLESHATRIYEGLGQGQQATTVLSRKILKQDLPNPFKLRDVVRKNYSMLQQDKNTIQAALDKLCELNWLYEYEPERTASSGRNPSFEYHINPQLFLS